MTAGRELDALVAEKVMGWEQPTTWPDVWNTHSARGTIAKSQFCPSTDIAAAWEVVSFFDKKFSPNCMVSISGGQDQWEVQIDSNDGRFLQNGSTVDVFGWGMSPAHAICLAALKAVGAI